MPRTILSVVALLLAVACSSVGVDDKNVASQTPDVGPDGATLPELIPESRTRPVYPENARLARIEGKVILQVFIGYDGTVSELQVLRSTVPDMGFEQAAVEALQQWRYKPAMKDGEPVDTYFTVIVEFELT